MDIVHQNIHYAIQQRLLMELNYEGEGVRLVEPYCFGLGSTGKFMFRVYQIKGYSTSIIPGWKLLDIGKISEMKILSEKFDPTLRDEYHIGDKAMKTIFAQIY